MENTILTKEITIPLKNNATSRIQNEDKEMNVIVKDMFKLGEANKIEVIDNTIEEENLIWATISNNSLEKQSNKAISNYKSRTALINMIIESIGDKKLNGINIDFKGITDTDNYIRFIIELAPRLREIGISSNVVINNNMEKEKLVGVVDYLINEKE